MMHNFLLRSSMKHHHHCYQHYHLIYYLFCEELAVGAGSVYVKCV